MMTNCNLKYDYEKALHALRVLYPTDNRVIEPSLAPVKDLARAGGSRWGKSNSSYVTGADLDESRNLPSPGTPEHTETCLKEVSDLILEAQKLGNTSEAYETYSAANERLKEVTLARGFRPAEVRSTSKGGGKFGKGRPKGFGKGRSGSGKGGKGGGGRDGRRKGKGKGRGGPRPPQIRPRENESWEDLKRRTKCHVCDKTGHWKGSPDCKGAPSMSSLLCGGCNHPMSETYSRLRADYDEIMEYLTYYGEELEANTEDPNSDEKEYDIDEWYDYLTYISSSPEQEQPPVHDAALAFENPLAPDGSPLPSIQEGQNEDNYDDDYLGYYANYLTESYDAVIPPISTLAEEDVEDNYSCIVSRHESHRPELLSLTDRQGPEQDYGEGLLGDHPVASAASDDQIDSTALEQHLLLFDHLAEPVTEAADGHLHHHSVWMTENGTSCVSEDTEAFEVVESDGEEETPGLPPPILASSIPTSEALTFIESVESDDVSYLRESSCAEGEASLVVSGPQVSLPMSVPSTAISIPVIPNTSGTYLYMILDTACQRSVVGRQWLRGAGIELEARFGLQVTPYRQPLMLAFGPHPAELSEWSYSVPIGLAGISLAWRASGFKGRDPIMGADAMLQLGVMMSFPDEVVVFHSLHGYLEDGSPSGLRVTAPMYRTREVGGHIAVRIDEFPANMLPADFLPVDTSPGGTEIWTQQMDRHPDLSWNPEPGSIRRKLRDRSCKQICVVEDSSFTACVSEDSSRQEGPSDVVLVRNKRRAFTWQELKERTRCNVCNRIGHWRGSPLCLGLSPASSVPHGGDESTSTTTSSSGSSSSGGETPRVTVPRISRRDLLSHRPSSGTGRSSTSGTDDEFGDRAVDRSPLGILRLHPRGGTSFQGRCRVRASTSSSMRKSRGSGKDTSDAEKEARGRYETSLLHFGRKDKQLEADESPPPVFRPPLLRSTLQPDLRPAPSSSTAAGLRSESGWTTAPAPPQGLRRSRRHLLHRNLSPSSDRGEEECLRVSPLCRYGSPLPSEHLVLGLSSMSRTVVSEPSQRSVAPRGDALPATPLAGIVDSLGRRHASSGLDGGSRTDRHEPSPRQVRVAESLPPRTGSQDAPVRSVTVASPPPKTTNRQTPLPKTRDKPDSVKACPGNQSVSAPGFVPDRATSTDSAQVWSPGEVWMRSPGFLFPPFGPSFGMGIGCISFQDCLDIHITGISPAYTL